MHCQRCGSLKIRVARLQPGAWSAGRFYFSTTESSNFQSGLCRPGWGEIECDWALFFLFQCITVTRQSTHNLTYEPLWGTEREPAEWGSAMRRCEKWTNGREDGELWFVSPWYSSRCVSRRGAMDLDMYFYSRSIKLRFGVYHYIIM